jgi:hypothetical protein
MDRKILGWVVTLLPERKGGERKWERDPEKGDPAEMTPNKSERFIRKDSHSAFDAMHTIGNFTGKTDDERRRLRVFPVYAKRKRTAADERADVLAWLESAIDTADNRAVVKGLCYAKESFEQGAHDGALDRLMERDTRGANRADASDESERGLALDDDKPINF